MVAYPGLSNIVKGAGSNEYGPMHAHEIIQLYSSQPAVFRHKVLLICVNSSAAETGLYEATCYSWKVKQSKAAQADVVLATIQGKIVGAFVDCRWFEATADHFPDRDPVPGRWGFKGKEAPDDIQQLYVGKRVPDEFRKPGAANPIKYTW